MLIIAVVDYMTLHRKILNRLVVKGAAVEVETRVRIVLKGQNNGQWTNW